MDLDRDGLSDLIVGAPDRDVFGDSGVRSGGAFVYRGTVDGMDLKQAITQAGIDLDEDGDGFGDAISLSASAASPN